MASLAFLAHHEARLGWRELLWMLTRGRRRRLLRVGIGFALFVLFLHWLSYVMLTHGVTLHRAEDLQTFVAVTSSVGLSWMLMLSQAMEMITRGFYTRADLDLILSSPVDARRVFALRVGVNAILVSFMSVVLFGPVVNMLAVTDSARWLAGYGLALAMGLTATAIATLLTVLLFNLVGPKRTRFIAQIMAALVGAAFVIGIQVVAIVNTGSLSRVAFLHSPLVLNHAPELTSLFWLPARAIMGDLRALVLLCIASVALFAVVTLSLVGRFAHYVTAAAGVAQRSGSHAVREHFAALTPLQALKRKEATLIRRDPWLISQTLMQLLYLAPPALLLWKNLTDGGNAVLVLVPVLVMAAGQLAGGITWITISGEDAPDLVATAPLMPRQIMMAKLQAVARAIAIVFSPLIVMLLFESPWGALVCASGIIIASLCSATIQLWFRTHAHRSTFRRRHTASRIATFAEAFCCISWAAASGMIAAQTWFAVMPIVVALLVLLIARSLRTYRP